MMAQFFPGVWGRLALGVANHLWQSTVFAFLAAVLTLALKRNHARVRYWLWFAASAKFLVPFSLLVALGGHLSWLHHISPKQGVDGNAGSYLVMEEVSQPFALMNVAQMSAEATPERLSATERLKASLGGSFVAAALTAVWLFGALFVLVTWMRRWWRISAATRHAPALEEGREAETLRRMERLAGLRRRIELKVLPVTVEPGIFGLRRPVLLWPEGISERFEDAQLEAVIAHEVCHVRRGDNLTAALHMAVEAIFWFHPLVWWLETRLVEERESACDEEVLELCGQARAYAESILKVCEFCIESPLACVSGVTGADLKRRVAGIVSGRALMRLSWPKKMLLVTVAVCVVAVPMLLGSVQNPVHALVAEGQALTKGWQTAAGGKLEFEVASVRPSATAVSGGANFVLGPGNVYAKTGGRFSAHNLTLVDYIRFAYKLTDSQTKLMEDTAPKWVSTEQFDIEARSDNHDPTKDQMRLMMQSLLADRFNLKVHTESRDLPVLAMVLAKQGKLGPQLRPHPADGPPCSNLRPAPSEPRAPTASAVVDGGYPAICGGLTDAGTASVPSHMRIGARDVPLTLLVSNLGGFDRPLVDRTGLKGTYDFFFEWGADPAIGSDAAARPGDPGTTLEEALRDQLGIKLVRERAPVDVLVVDHVEHPSAQNDAAPPAAAGVVASTMADKRSEADQSLTATFEVSTVKPGDPNARSSNLNFGRDDVRSSNLPISFLLQFAYGLNRGSKDQIVGAPAWVSSTPFNIDAKMDEATAANIAKMPPDERIATLRRMVQSLLTIRFHLVIHHETRALPVLALMVAKDGPKLVSSSVTPTPVGQWTGLHTPGPGQMEGRDVTISELTSSLSDKPEIDGQLVVDNTGLQGKYNFTLAWTPENSHTIGSDNVSGPSLFTALKEQLGLYLDSRKAPVDVLVIDHIERPSEN